MKIRSEHKADADLIQTFLSFHTIDRRIYAQHRKHVRTAGIACCSLIAMLCDPNAGSSDHECSAGGDIEGLRLASASTDQIDERFVPAVDANTSAPHYRSQHKQF